MAADFATLDRMIAACKRLAGPTMAEEVAREAAPLVQDAVRATASAGTTPLGQPWKPKKGGGRPLAHAASHVTAAPAGRVILVTLQGPDVFHHLGSKRLPRRQIIPDGVSTPKAVHDAALLGARRVFSRITGGARA